MEYEKKMLALFENFSQRLYSENNLSDITWAFMETFPEFQKMFLKFCFKNIKITEVIEVIREYTGGSKDSRPDFYIKTKETDYIIEVKINDRKGHFLQYNNNIFQNVKDENRCFIANYPYSEREDPDAKRWILKTWRDFAKGLEEWLSSNPKEKIFFEPYLAYLKSTLEHKEIANMNLSNLDSIYKFYVHLKKIIEENAHGIVFKSKKSFDEESFGKYVYYKNKTKKKVAFWLGLFFTGERGVYIGFNVRKDIPSEEASLLKSMKEEGLHYYKTYSDNWYWFKLKERCYKKLCDDKISADAQQEVLKSFFEEVMSPLI